MRVAVALVVVLVIGTLYVLLRPPVRWRLGLCDQGTIRCASPDRADVCVGGHAHRPLEIQGKVESDVNVSRIGPQGVARDAQAVERTYRARAALCELRPLVPGLSVSRWAEQRPQSSIRARRTW